ncbi:helix-turn-helix transcriptional regulator [Desertimonas flava]|uniref:helix-turn-helix transcriptional regulator n=1 Tax=Desertimonas flava TaxID=2064846 RepID=UPI0013C4E897|nr:LuxR family transcriptional regulator [Desertimonas flava]
MLLGRASELAALVAHATEVVGGSGRLIEMIGPAGVGKSTVLSALVTQLRNDGFVVWSHSATRAEQSLSWTALAALLPLVSRELFDGLDTSRRRHLESIMDPDPAAPVQPHGVAAALGNLMSTAAMSRPLAIVLDDEQWLDVASAGAFTFAARSLPSHPLIIVIARRPEEPTTIAAAVAPASRFELRLGPLDADVLADIIGPITGPATPRHVLRALCERADGNPMFAIELARQVAAGRPLSHALTPRSLLEAVRPSLDALTPESRTALQFAALLAVPAVDVIGAALGTDDALAVLGPAERAGLVELSGSKPTIVRFTHPAIPAAALATLSTAELRAANTALAGLVGDAESRGMHLAASQPAVDRLVAADLETAGDLAVRRGAPHSAAHLYGAAVAATPPDRDAELRRRQFALADAQRLGAQHGELLDTLATITVADGSDDAERVATMRVSAIATVKGLAAARSQVIDDLTWIRDPNRRMTLFGSLVQIERLDHLDRGLDTALRAAHDARRYGVDEAIEGASLAVAASRALVGEPVDVDTTVRLAETWPEPALLSYATDELLRLLWFVGDARGIDWCERTRAAAITAGFAAQEIQGLILQAGLHPPRGDWARAEHILRDILRHELSAASERADLAYVLATTGRTDEARQMLAAIESSEFQRGRTNAFLVQARRGMTSFTLGDGDALDQLELADQLAAEIGLRGPRVVPYRRDLVEALTMAGRLDDAQTAADRLSVDADRCQLDNARADADAALAVVAAATGDADQAARLFTRAAKVHDCDGDRYELARTQLAAGRAARRAQRRSEARRCLDEAAALFSDMGAVPWLKRCQIEAARIGGRPKRSAALTPTERQIAERAAAGATNAEIAAAMFVSVRTVESNLSRCYRKLQIRSRVDLAAALSRIDAVRPTPDGEFRVVDSARPPPSKPVSRTFPDNEDQRDTSS